MDSGQYDFLITICSKCLYFLDHIFFGTASHSSSCIWNNTVRAELITSVLYFDIRSCMLSCTAQMKILILLCMSDINKISCSFSLLFVLFEDLHNIFLFIITNHNINAIVHFLILSLHITAGCHYDCIRIHLSCLVQHLSGLTVRNVCNCACIDYINICTFFERHDLITVFFQKLLHGFCFICIYFTSKIMQCCFLHNFLFPSLYKLFLDFLTTKN